MILLCGIPTEPPLEKVSEALSSMGAPHVIFNQRAAGEADLHMGIETARVSGSLRINGDYHSLESISGVYTRLMDANALPEVAEEPSNSPRRRHYLKMHDAMLRWLEITNATVINRAAPMASNHSKPYQAQIVGSFGFAVPDTLITNDPEAVREFRRHHGRVVYKSTSGARSIVQELDDEDMSHLDRIRWCPVQFQQYVPGLDVRVHVVGKDTFATAIHSDQVDYRYAHRQEGSAELNPLDLDLSVTEACVAVTSHMGLAFSGIDLRQAPDGSIYCFEVNPSPAFSFYESHTGQPIARAVANYLASAEARDL